ncbi:MAG: M24 family metallopeptidase [Gammaproteobacteria bacterium]|nr:M24 family metallopeptidase [Gammaproteobacteria bacterium]MBU2058287.1 M24 family metallopeptidase [Gammaproteobacteria bacterium]MBU2176660.1 M24 family metallopeptidase [Gammaproteobacteria bacterium]MBU2248398.1 M24 family metallopeptidase [Gammaproteobacteria bacterium]MBU2345739.1 M24 family metallopeptidase [Gammaproteobacteria bacterium]
MKNKMTALALAALVTIPTAFATEFTQGRQLQSANDFSVLTSRERVGIENRILTERLEQLLPQLMTETQLDMWLVINREYSEDPVYFTLVPQPTFAARRTTMLVFYRKADGSVELLSVNRYPFGAPYSSAWSGGDLTEQWQALAKVITERNPKRIGINLSTDWAVADGLTKAMHQLLLEVLPTDYASRLVSAESLVVRWMEQRTASELELYPHIVSLARAVIAEAFSAKVITPGVTSTDDVAWYIRQRFEALGLPIWFMPDVNSQRPGDDCKADSPFCGQSRVIHRGDVLHTDVGICYLKLCTDTQEMAYVLKADEQDAPAGLIKALATGNQWQDNLTRQFKTGRTGNEILAATIKESKKQGIISSTYTHPLGFVGHAPGPTIGMWDNQGPDADGGNWPLYANTAYAIEGNIKQQLAEWNGHYVQIKLEQSAYFDGKEVIYLAGRQTKWHLVR